MSQFTDHLETALHIYEQLVGLGNVRPIGRNTREYHAKLIVARRELTAADKILKVMNRKGPQDCGVQGCWEAGEVMHSVNGSTVWLCAVHSSTSSWPQVTPTGGQR